MRAADTKRRNPWAMSFAALIIVMAVVAVSYAVHRRAAVPSTDDATIDADLVHIAAAVGGRIVAIPVAENDTVVKGDLLFQIDPVPYELAIAQSAAELDLAKAALDTQRRALSTQRSTATVAGDQVKRAAANLELASRTVERLSPLTEQGFASKQQLDQAQTSARDAATSFRQARVQQTATERAVDTEAAGEATVRAREAALAIARRALEDTTVRAPHAGRIVGLTVSSGEMVIPSQSLFTLVDTDEWFAVGNFREFDLAAVTEGDCATVYSMIDRGHPIKGVVQGIGSAVLDEDRINIPHSVPYIERSLNWVRVAQRFPVRVRLDSPPNQLMRLGASAIVEVKHGPACR